MMPGVCTIWFPARRVSDARVAETDPTRVVAFIERSDRAAQIVWMRGSVARTETFRSLGDALDAVATAAPARVETAAETVRLPGDLSRRA
ncbi:MAG TPA: hypothetical protein VEX12_13875 [Microbacterium sp.]|nr:hypothetical protein [Microbacterium sp.]